MEKTPLSEREKKIYNYITGVIRRDGYSPSVRDIQQALDIKSTSTVHAYLERLEEKGLIQKESGKSRTLRVDSSASQRRVLRIPLLGKVRAGQPILAVENLETYIDFPMANRFYRQNELFALRVTGDSMIGAGIIDGDIIVVQKQSDAADGQIVVAMIGDEATVKTFYREKDCCRLQPENPAMKPIFVKELLILGRVVSVMRYYR
ncbi:MAG: transcriptional repressor LexA [Firmicutes bacterium]|nr:transcriptional repressor LexA [Bacillota bacterium]